MPAWGETLPCRGRLNKEAGGGRPSPFFTMNRGICKGKDCRKPVNWVITARGRKQPLELNVTYVLRVPVLTKDMKSTTIMTPQGYLIQGIKCDKDTEGAVAGYEPHHIYCPNAGSFKKKANKG